MQRNATILQNAKDMEEVLQSMRRNLYGEMYNNYAISTFYHEKGKCIPYLIHIL